MAPRRHHCLVCGDPATVARRRCHRCYEYRRVYGRDRSEELIIAWTTRIVERNLASRRSP